MDVEREKARIFERLQTVKDPEMPVISVVELGMIEDVVMQDDCILIKVLPTFLGCPAIDMIKDNLIQAVEAMGKRVEIEFNYAPPWTSDRITKEGREKLKKFGIAPPPVLPLTREQEWTVSCPYCGSLYTILENVFGPAACRSMLYCKSCKNPFEAMKPIFQKEREYRSCSK